VLERLSTEALRSFDVYKAQGREKRVDTIFLCGGGAGFKNLAAFLSSGLGIEVSVFDPFAALLIPAQVQNDSSFQQHKHRLPVALGLSTGRCRDINFLPPRPGMLETAQLRNWLPLLLFIIFFSALATMYLYSYRSVAVSREELNSKKSQFSSLKSYMEEMLRLNEKKENLKQRLSQVPDFSFEQPQFSEILSSLTRILPENTVLQSIALETGSPSVSAAAPAPADKELVMKLRLEGVVFGDDSQVLTTVVQITSGLENSAYFKKVMLVSTEKVTDLGKPASRFVFSCPLDAGTF
jgi:Tfp pilus assembly protein PilN